MADPRIVDNAFTEARPCGPCSLCCKLYPVEELAKPIERWCPHVVTGSGCAIHATRPIACRNFQCLWTYAAPLDERWRPDNCHFVMRPGNNALEVVIDVDPDFPGAWKAEPFYAQIRAWSTRREAPHRIFVVRDGGRMAVVFPEGEVDLGPETWNEPIESGYVFRSGRQQPYAHFGPPGSPPKPVAS
jgi:hypothetical protein